MKRISDNLYQYLVHLYDTSTTYDIHEFLLHSEIYIDAKTALFNIPDSLTIIVDPEVFKKYSGMITRFKPSISKSYTQVSGERLSSVDVFPDLEKFHILKNSITPVLTPWNEINQIQTRLIEQLRTAKQTIDFQNIGNSSRTLLQKLAGLVFKPDRHKAEENIDLSEGMYKNRLHTYIKVELEGKENKELRSYATSVITTAEKSVDLANKLTHDLNASMMMAESCVISAVTVVGLIKLVQK